MTIKNLAERMIKQYHTNDPFELAKRLKIKIVYENLGGTMGYFTNDFRIKFIHINQYLNEKDSTFTCSHELGHAILHPDVNTPFLKRYTLFSTSKIERQANTFAVEFLIPDSMLEEGSSIYDVARSVGVPTKLAELKQF